MDQTPQLPSGRTPPPSQRPAQLSRGSSSDPLPRYARHLAAVVAIVLALVGSRIDLAAWTPKNEPIPLELARPSSETAPSAEIVASESEVDAILARQEISPLRLDLIKTEIGYRPTPTMVVAAEAPAAFTPGTSIMGIGGYEPTLSPEEELSIEAYDTRAIGGDSLGIGGLPDQISRTEIITYEVQAGDILGTIAEKFGVSVDTIAWANGRLADNPDYLRIGQHLFILPVTGVMHVIDKGDTLSAIAKQYKSTVEEIIAYEPNGLQEWSTLTEGQVVIIPDGKKPYVPRVVHAWSGTPPTGASTGSGSFVWPATGVLTQKFWSKHQAIDIGYPEGTPIIAADSGYVSLVSSSNTGYGRYVMINHGNGYTTLYAHFKTYFVQEGQSVAKGELIGLMGSTGNSTGPHLHFEIRKGSTKVNPLNYLP